jgi:hypothetical protein
MFTFATVMAAILEPGDRDTKMAAITMAKASDQGDILHRDLLTQAKGSIQDPKTLKEGAVKGRELF